MKKESKRLTIIEFLQTKKISNHLKNCLKNVLYSNTNLDYMDQLDVDFLKTQRNFGDKKLTELSKLYPELKGLEYNNGWIKIESEKDLPKSEYGQYHVYSEKELFSIEPKNQGIEPFWINDPNKSKEWLDNFSHYQPIEKPKPPKKLN